MSAAALLAGRVVWRELSTSRPVAARDFVVSLFGWTASPAGVAESYQLCSGERPVGVVTRRSSGDPSPLGWTVHITVEQLGPALERLVRLGGQVVAGAERVGGLGSRALVSDPLGVLFYLVELDQPSALRADLPLANDFYWTELACERPARHVGFYRDLLGWTAELTPLGDLELHFLSSGGERVASVVADRDLAGEAGWISYVQVADVEASCARAVELGGSVCRRPVTLPGLGCFAAITDTLGTRLALWKSQS